MTFTRDQLEEWLLGYADGDLSSFDAFYNATHRLVFAALCKRVGNAEAGDLLQETYLRIHRHVRSYKKGGNALSWLLTIAHNVATDHQTRSRRFPLVYEIREVLEHPTPQSEVAPSDLDFEELIAGLNDEDKQLIRERFEQGLSYAQLAKNHQAAEATIRQRLSRVIKKIRLKATP